MSRLVAGVAMQPHRYSLIGALGGLLAAAGRDLPVPYLAGVTGHAFQLTLDLVFSPGSAFELNFHEVFPRWEQLGAWFKRLAVRPVDDGYPAGRAMALERIQAAVADGRPVMSYDLLGLPEYGLVVGADETHLACLTLNNLTEPEWMAAAEWPPEAHRQFTRAEAILLLDLAPKFNRERAEVASLRFAVEHFWAPASRDNWVQSGQKAYEYWIAVLTSPLPLHGADPGLGHSYNLLLLQRLRRDAAVYLTELAPKYPQAPAIARAAEQYAAVAGAVGEATRLLPFPGLGIADADVRQAVAASLREALAAERAAVAELERALRGLR